MRYRLLLGCLCIGNGIMIFITRLINNLNFDTFDSIIFVLLFAIGIYLIYSEMKMPKLEDK